MHEYANATLHHFFLLGLQTACLSSLAQPYWGAVIAGRWNDYIMDKSWGFGRFLGDSCAATVYVLHLYTWAQSGPQPIFLFYSWTVMLAIWTIYRHKQIKSTSQENAEV